MAINVNIPKPEYTPEEIGAENVVNKKTTLEENSDTFYPTQKAVKTAVDAKENTITTGTTSQYFRGDKTFQTLDKTAVGLGSVDNTSDLNKPISTSTQTALNTKVDKVTGKSLIDDTEISRLASMTAIFTSALKTAYDGAVTWISTNGANILAHLSNTSNPHSVTATQADALKRDGSNANLDVDLGIYSINAKSVNVKGTGGNGHLGLKHQSADATATGSETVIFAGSDGEPRYKNDGGTVAQFASRAWVTAQGYITNVITALGYTPVPTTRTINGYDLSANRTLSASDVGAVASNSAITGATKTKITYDSKGLVTSGSDATTADISDSTNKRYVSDAQLTVIGNTSGTNSGDETATTIRTKLGITTLSGSNTGDETQATIISKLGYTPQAQFLSKLVFKEQYGGSVTGTTSETLIKTFTFSANELPTDTTLYVETLGYRTGTPTANGTFRLKINTSNTLSGATQIAQWGMGGNTNVHTQNRRRFLITGGNIIGYASSFASNTDLTTTTNAESINTLDVTSTFYLFVTYTPVSSGDTLNHGFTILKNF